MHAVDSPHNSLGPLDCAGDERFSPGAGARVMQVFRVLEVPSDEYAGYDRQNSFASFFHPQQGSTFAIYSPYAGR